MTITHETTLRGELARIWALSWPVSTGMIGLMGMSVVDTIMVGRLGEAPMASVALGTSWFFSFAVVAQGALRALDPILAQAHGARDHTAMTRGVVLGVAMAAAMTLPLAATQMLAAPGLRLLGQPEALLPTAAVWSTTAAWGVPGLLLFSAFRQALQGLGQMRAATYAIVLANIFNVIANAVLIFGLDLGPRGAAVATALSEYVLAGLTLYFGRHLLLPALAAWRDALALGPFLRLLAIGVPLGVQMAMEAWAFHFAGLMMGWLGPTAIAANAVVLNLATVSFMVPFGVSSAAATRVGNLVGAGLPWAFAGRVALLLGGGLMGVSALAFALLPGVLARVYTDDPAVIAVVVTLLPIAAAFQLFDGLQVVAFGVLRGAGDIRLPSLANLLGYWALGLPLGAWLAFRQDWGVQGVITGLALGVTAVAVLLVGRVAWMSSRSAIRMDVA